MMGEFLQKITGECWGFDVLASERLIYVAYKKNIQAIDTSKIALSIWNNGIESNRLVIIKTDGRIVKAFPNHEKFQSGRSPLVSASRFHRSLFRYNDKIRYHPYYSDSLFSLVNEQLCPIFIENKIFKAPLQYRLEYLGDNEEFKEYCLKNNAYATRFFETSRFLLVTYNLGHIFQILLNYLLYDKHFTMNFTMIFGKFLFNIIFMITDT
jgi:hypothetical protein